MKVDTTQCLDYRSELRKQTQDFYGSCYEELDKQVAQLIQKETYYGPHGRREFDSGDFWPMFNSLCDAFIEKHSYCFVANFIEIFMPFFARGVGVAENGHAIDREMKKRAKEAELVQQKPRKKKGKK